MLMHPSALFKDGNELEPGWYDNVPEETYHSWDLCSNSRLSVIAARSPAHLRYSLDNPKDTTKSQRLGIAAHSAILEPALFDVRYAPLPENLDLRKTVDKERVNALKLIHEGKRLIKAEEYSQACNMSQAIWANLDARTLLESVGYLELSIVFDDPDTGLRCKARLDKLSDEFQCTVDVKSCDNAHPSVFERQIFNLGYHRQGLFYTLAANTVGLVAKDHVIIAVEKTPPYATVVYRLKPEALELAAYELKSLKQTYKQCVTTGVWHGYPDGLVWVGVPTWALKRMDHDNDD